MLLAVDIGNTNTVFAVFKGDTLLKSWRLKTDSARTSDEYAAFLGPLLAAEKLSFADITDTISASVVPDANYQMTRFVADYLANPIIAVSRDNVPIEVDIKEPQDVGADRMVNALTVKAEYDLPAVVVDFGTATTFDVIDAQGRYGGGVIAPGIKLSLSALHEAAARLPMVSIKKPPGGIIGKKTTEAMQSGIFYGYKGLIEGILAAIEEQIGTKPYVIATGGLANFYAEHISAIDKVDETLTLRGLLQIYQGQKA